MKYRFEIIYANKWMKQASEFLSQCDLQIVGVGIKETMTFTSKNDLPIDLVKQKFKEAFESCECEILRIEGGKVE